MLKRLFTSNTRIKLLSTFLANEDQEYYIRELTRKLDEQINSIRRELNNLKKMGFLKSKMKARKKYYFVNTEFIILDELRSIFAKVLASKHGIANDIEKIGAVKILVLSGQFTNQDSDLDMLIVGDIDKDKLASYINDQISTEKPVKFAIMSEEDYKYRLSCNDKFISSLIANSSNKIPIKKI